MQLKPILRKAITYCTGITTITALILAGCGGGGGSSTSSPPPSLNIVANPLINAKTSHDLRTAPFRINRSGISNSLFSNAMAYADIDGDTDIDLFVAPGDTSPGSSGTGTPTAIRMYRNTTGSLATDTTIWGGSTVPTTIWPRKALTGDYNGDGVPDFAVIDHGWDAPPFPGAAPLVILSAPGGTYKKATGLDTLIGFHHGGASGDIDNDGDIDIFLAAGGGNTGNPMFLLNDGTGNFTVNTDRIPSELRTNTLPFFSAELVDIDGDGFLDLQVGGVEPPSGNLRTTIYWGSTSGYYDASLSTQLPTVSGYTDQLDFDARDLDGDGDRDLLITRTSHNYQGYSIQYLRNDGNRSFTDVTATRITGSSDATAPWIDWISVGDVNGDGFIDIYTENATPGSADVVWINDGSGNFTRASASTASTMPVITPL